MLRLAIFSILALAVVAMPFSFDKLLDNDWELFKKHFGKNYTIEEEYYRRNVWESSYKVVSKHNLEHDLGVHSFRLGMNSFSDMTNKEFTSQMNGYKPRKDAPKAVGTFLPPQNVQLPSSMNWTAKGFVTEVKNQGECGSCWSFSATGSLEGQTYAKTGVLPDLSEQNLVDCSGPEGDDGCDGGLMDDAFKYVQQNGGIDSEVCYPYKAKDEKRCHYVNSSTCDTAHCTGYVDLESGSEAQLLQASGSIGPISVAIDASHSSFQMYSGGVYDEESCSTTELDHGVLVVGYGVDADSGKDYWLVKNSWGAEWGLHGYIMMSRNNNNQCGIATSASYPLV